MHDIDRAMFEIGQETFGETGEIFGESFESFESASESEAHEMELAARLLEVNSEAELEQFLGGLVRSAASAARNFAASSTGQALGGVLKNAARQVLPQVGRVLGDAVSPGVGGQIGQRAGQWLGGQFELEGLSAEDREFELARAVVRLGQDATRSAVCAGPSVPPQQAAIAAAAAAAKRHLPGLVPVIRAGTTPVPVPSTARSGRWVRRGNRIVLLGV